MTNQYEYVERTQKMTKNLNFFQYSFISILTARSSLFYFFKFITRIFAIIVRYIFSITFELMYIVVALKLLEIKLYI